jgi:hypothetical protein
MPPDRGSGGPVPAIGVVECRQVVGIFHGRRHPLRVAVGPVLDLPTRSRQACVHRRKRSRQSQRHLDLCNAFAQDRAEGIAEHILHGRLADVNPWGVRILIDTRRTGAQRQEHAK